VFAYEIRGMGKPAERPEEFRSPLLPLILNSLRIAFCRLVLIMNTATPHKTQAQSQSAGGSLLYTPSLSRPAFSRVKTPMRFF
jgi:hypothetical protein